MTGKKICACGALTPHPQHHLLAPMTKRSHGACRRDLKIDHLTVKMESPLTRKGAFLCAAFAYMVQAEALSRDLHARQFTETPNLHFHPIAPTAASTQAQAVPESPTCREDIPRRETDAVFKRLVK